MNNRWSSLTHLFTEVTRVINIYQALPACYQGRGKAAPDPLGPEVGHLSNPLALPYNVDCLGLDLPPSCRPMQLRAPVRRLDAVFRWVTNTRGVSSLLNLAQTTRFTDVSHI